MKLDPGGAPITLLCIGLLSDITSSHKHCDTSEDFKRDARLCDSLRPLHSPQALRPHGDIVNTFGLRLIPGERP